MAEIKKKVTKSTKETATSKERRMNIYSFAIVSGIIKRLQEIYDYEEKPKPMVEETIQQVQEFLAAINTRNRKSIEETCTEAYNNTKIMFGTNLFEVKSINNEDIVLLEDKNKKYSLSDLLYMIQRDYEKQDQ